MKTQILAIDDDSSFLNFLKLNLSEVDYNTIIVSDSNTAITEIKRKDIDCILLDVKIPGVNGLELLAIALKYNPNIPVIMVSGQSNIKIAVEALKLGAFDFIEKPIDVAKLHITIKNAIEKKNLSAEKDLLLSELQDNYQIIGNSQEIKEIISQIKSIADTPAKVLIQGETGTGKELVAWAIHHYSSRRSKPYIKINCAAIPSELLESELFGFHKGAFTGATNNKIGKFIAADGGTLFLDEIGDMNLNLQSKILRVLEENEVDILGENSPHKIDVRIITATNQNIEKKIIEGTFRKDLFYRLNVANIFIPPLRSRKTDIVPIAYYFIKKFSESYNKKIYSIRQNAEQLLINYNYPGNVRELRNIIEKIVLYCNSDYVDFNDVQNIFSNKYKNTYDLPNSPNDLSFKDAKNDFERNYLIA